MPRTIELDMEQFHTFFDKGWNKSKLAKAAKVSRGTITNILNYERATPTIIAAIAKAFETTSDCLVLHHPLAHHSLILHPLMAEYKEMLRQELLSEDYIKYAQSNDGLYKTNFLCFVYSSRADYVNSLDLSPNSRMKVHEELCREGLLWKKQVSGLPVYVCRQWSKEQCDEDYDLRVGVEVLAVHRAVQLIDRSPTKHADICHKLESILETMEQLLSSLDGPGATESALRMLDFDCKFHKAWAGDAPDFKACLAAGLAGHRQVIYRYISVLKIAEKSGFEIPKNLPDVVTHARSCYADLSGIYRLFAAVETPQDGEAIQRLIDAVENHPKNGWGIAKKIEAFIREQSNRRKDP